MKKASIFLWLTLILSMSVMAQNRYTETILDENDSTIIEQLTFEDSTLIMSTHYIYESMGSLAVIIKYSYRDNGAVDTRTLENYHNNKIIGRWQYTADDLLLLEEHWKYNHQGRLTLRKQIFYDGAYVDTLVEKRK